MAEPRAGIASRVGNNSPQKYFHQSMRGLRAKGLELKGCGGSEGRSCGGRGGKCRGRGTGAGMEDQRLALTATNG